MGGRAAIERRGGASEERRLRNVADEACGCEQLVCAAVAALALAIPPDRSYHPRTHPRTPEPEIHADRCLLTTLRAHVPRSTADSRTVGTDVHASVQHSSVLHSTPPPRPILPQITHIPAAASSAKLAHRSLLTTTCPAHDCRFSHDMYMQACKRSSVLRPNPPASDLRPQITHIPEAVSSAKVDRPLPRPTAIRSSRLAA